MMSLRLGVHLGRLRREHVVVGLERLGELCVGEYLDKPLESALRVIIEHVAEKLVGCRAAAAVVDDGGVVDMLRRRTDGHAVDACGAAFAEQVDGVFVARDAVEQRGDIAKERRTGVLTHVGEREAAGRGCRLLDIVYLKTRALGHVGLYNLESEAIVARIVGMVAQQQTKVGVSL